MELCEGPYLTVRNITEGSEGTVLRVLMNYVEKFQKGLYREPWWNCSEGSDRTVENWWSRTSKGPAGTAEGPDGTARRALMKRCRGSWSNIAGNSDELLYGGSLWNCAEGPDGTAESPERRARKDLNLRISHMLGVTFYPDPFRQDSSIV